MMWVLAELQSKKVLVVGLGRSGVAASRLLLEMGAQVTVTDHQSPERLQGSLQQIGTVVPAVLGTYPSVRGFDLIVTSPGVPLTEGPLAEAISRDIPIWSELELASLLVPGPIVAITGTNGKTTTTALMGQIFRDAGRPVLVAGNIGLPLTQEVQGLSTAHTVILEVSSFQLEAIHSFYPKVAALLNMTPDHLDRHGDMAQYLAIKARIFANQQPGDVAVLNDDDPMLKELGTKLPARVGRFSRCHPVEEGAYLAGNQLRYRWAGREEVICSVTDIKLRGSHNHENVLAAVVMARAMGIDASSLAATLRNFNGVEHRIELVEVIGGVKYINDSKGTNPESTIRAIAAYSEPLVLIAGGKNKGSDFTELARIIKDRVRVLVLLGEAAPALEQAMLEQGYTAMVTAGSFSRAVELAMELAAPGEVVLLSPACASWDMFNNFEERGELFKQLVRQRKGEFDASAKRES